MNCLLCNVEIPESLIVKKSDRYFISGEWAAHYNCTHGFPVELFEMMVNGMNEKTEIRDKDELLRANR